MPGSGSRTSLGGPNGGKAITTPFSSETFTFVLKSHFTTTLIIREIYDTT